LRGCGHAKEGEVQCAAAAEPFLERKEGRKEAAEGREGGRKTDE